MAAVGHAELHILAPRSAEESSSVMQRAAMHLLSPMTLAITILSKSLEVSSNLIKVFQVCRQVPTAANPAELHKLSSVADNHTLYLFKNGFDFQNAPNYRINHKEDPASQPKKPSYTMDSWLTKSKDHQGVDSDEEEQIDGASSEIGHSEFDENTAQPLDINMNVEATSEVSQT